MKRKSYTELKVGVFVFIASVAFMIVVFMLGGQSRILARDYMLYAKFSDISGLRVGAPVMLAGLKIGFVHEIHFPKSLDDKDLTVSMRIQDKYSDRIRQDSFAIINTQGLLGDKYISISVGSSDKEILKDETFIETRASGSIFSLGDKAGRMMDDVAKAAQSIRNIMESVEGKSGSGDLKQTLADIRDTVKRAKEGPGLIHALLFDPEGEKVVSQLSNIFGSTGNILKEAEKEAPGKMGGMISNLNEASADFKIVMRALSRGEGTAGKLIMDPGLYDDLRDLFGGLSRKRMLRTVIRQTVQQEQTKTNTEQ